jgi:hypothetical protein
VLLYPVYCHGGDCIAQNNEQRLGARLTATGRHKRHADDLDPSPAHPLCAKTLVWQHVDDPVLVKFRAALNELYGDRIERVVLFGSRARGDAHPDSDYDVAVFLKDLDDRWAEADKIAITTTNILLETGEMIHAMPYRAGSYRERTPLMHELRREGRDL